MFDVITAKLEQQTHSSVPRLFGPGDTIGPYRIVESLAAGGMGVVYRAKDETTRQQVAVKTISAVDEAVVESIRREIHALRRIRHPGIVQVLASGSEGGMPWYAMELLSGATLRDLLRTS